MLRERLILLNLFTGILLNLMHNPIQEIFVIVVMGSQPMSPKRPAVGADLLYSNRNTSH